MPQTITIQAEKLNKEQDSFKILYLSYYSRLFVFSRTIVKDKALAEDVVEDVFLKLWENRQIIPTIKNISYYLFVSAKHTCLNVLQKQKRVTNIAREELADQFHFTFSNPETDMLTRENLRLIEDALNSLPERCRLIFFLVKEENLKHREVAQILDISPKTVEAQMTIAFKRISEKLADRLPYELRRFLEKRI